MLYRDNIYSSGKSSHLINIKILFEDGLMGGHTASGRSCGFALPGYVCIFQECTIN